MSHKQIYKNTACACLGLVFISISALIMIQIFFQQDISAQIQTVSVLKDIKYATWGKNPNPSGSQYLQTFTLYGLEEIDGQIHATKSGASKTYQYNYEYQNTSLAQGNSGRLNFINKWELKQVTANMGAQQNIKTINLAADKIYNYDYYAPPQRKIPILYGYIQSTLTNEFLQKFYSAYLMQFFFQYKDLVYQTVFKPLNIDQQRAIFIYEHPQYGWSSVQSFQNWVKLSLRGHSYAITTQQYQTFITQFGLTPKQISNLVFQKSTLYNMIAALNGTILSKVSMTKYFGYKCKGKFCTNEQLVAFQLSSAFLTQDPLFSSVGLNINTKDLNNTFLADIQYRGFCDKNKDAFDCMTDQSIAQFFVQQHLGNFEMMNLLWTNQDNFDLIEDQFGIPPGTGQSLVEYVKYLHNELIKKYESNIFSWVQTSYNHLESTVTSYKNLFLTQLYSRAFENKFIQKAEKTCEDYFSGDFEKSQDKVCKQESSTWNFFKTGVIRKYIQAYFFINEMRNQMSHDLQMSYQEIIAFFKNSQKSLFAKQIAEIDDIFRASFGCAQNKLDLCSPDQLFCMQWGSNKIFQNLPTQIFTNKIGSINEWDKDNILNGINPDYHSVIGKTKTVEECLNILSSDQKTGIFSFMNLLSIGKRAEVDSEAKDLLKYAGRNVIGIAFKGLLNTQDVNTIFQGFKSDFIEQKKKMKISSGGAPWMENEVKLIKTDNKAEIKNNELELVPQYDTINTGIYNQDKIREISKIWGESTSSSKYTVYRGKKEDDEGKQVPVDIFHKYVSDRKIAGTNILGFHPYIDSGENLLAYISQAYQAMTLVYKEETSYVDTTQLKGSLRAIKYKIVLNTKSESNSSFIGLEELNQNYFELSPQSYAIVEPTTGLTLEFKLIYTIKSNLLFTNFVLDQQNGPVELYESQIFYKRKGLSQLEQIDTDMNRKSTYTIISIAVCAGSFVFAIILGALYFKNRKQRDQNLQSLVSAEKDEDI